MKKLLLLIPVVLIMGCQKEEINLSNDLNKDSGETLLTKSSGFVLNENTVGEFHNIYVDKYYDFLKAKIEKIGYNALQESHFRNEFHNTLKEMLGKQNNAAFTQYGLQAYDEHLAINIQNLDDNFNYNISKINSTNASPEFKEFITEFLIEAKTKLSMSEKNDFCFECINLAETKLTGVELQMAKGTINVFSSSFEYWTLNYQKWQNLINPNDNSVITPTQRATISGVDAGAFAWGAAVGAAGGTVILPGVGTFTGWLGVGSVNGLGASIAKAVGDFVDWLIG